MPFQHKQKVSFILRSEHHFHYSLYRVLPVFVFLLECLMIEHLFFLEKLISYLRPLQTGRSKHYGFIEFENPEVCISFYVFYLSSEIVTLSHFCKIKFPLLSVIAGGKSCS